MPVPSEASAPRRFSVSRSTSSKRSLLSIAKPRAMSNASNISGCTTVKPSSSPTATTLSTSTVSATSNVRSPNATPVPPLAALLKRTSVSMSGTASQSSHRLPVAVTKRADPTSPSPVKGRRTSLIGPPSAFARSLSSVSTSQKPGSVQATPSRTRIMSEAPTPSRNAPTHMPSNSHSYSNSLSTGPSALSPINLSSSGSAKRMHTSRSMGGESTPSRVRTTSTSVTGGVPSNVKQATPSRTNVQGTPAKSPPQMTPGKSPAHRTPGKSPGSANPAKSPKITKTPEKSPHQAQLTPSKSHLLSVEKGQRKGSTASIGGGRHEHVAVLFESLLARTMSLTGPASVVNGSGPLSQVNGASTLVNANEGYHWDDRDADDITLEMITDIGEEAGDEEVSSSSGPHYRHYSSCRSMFR